MPDPPQGPTIPDSSRSWAAAALPREWANVQVPVVAPACYRIVREVARGGVGVILEAVDTRLQREVALKQLLRPGVNEQRFIREAVLTARLQHPSIVPIHEVGVFGAGEPFIAMKLVRGRSLREALGTAATAAERLELVSAVLSVAEAMAYAHSQRVIHCDLKPANVLLGSFGEVVVIDWGLARHLDTPDGSGEIVGTPAYMPPEQALGRPLDERADVYSLGVLLYEVLTGRRPVAGDSAREVLETLLTRKPADVEALVPEVNPELAAIVRKAMMPLAADRYRDAGELVVDLRGFVLGQAPRVRTELERDPAIEQAFAVELRERTVRALRAFCAVGIPVVLFFGVVVRIAFGGFDLRDVVPRSLGLTVLVLVFLSTRREWGRRHAAKLAMALIAFTTLAIVAASVLERDALGAFTESLVLLFLGSATLIPLQPRSTLWLLGTLTVVASISGLAWGRQLTDVRFLLQLAALLASTVIAVVGSYTNFTIRRSEFYNRHRLERANARLARLDRPR